MAGPPAILKQSVQWQSCPCSDLTPVQAIVAGVAVVKNAALSRAIRRKDQEMNQLILMVTPGAPAPMAVHPKSAMRHTASAPHAPINMTVPISISHGESMQKCCADS